MAFFPVTNATLSADHLAVFIQKEYQLENTVSCKLLKTGINHTYLITGQSQKFIFRVYSINWRTTTEILEEIRLLNLLKDQNLPVSFAIADGAGNYIKEFKAPEGIRFGVLFSHAEGSKALNYDTAIHFKVGETMARMHQVTHNLVLDRVTYTGDLLLHQSVEKLKQFLDPNEKEMIYIVTLRDFLKESIKQIDRSKIRLGAIHMDIWFDNMHFSDSGAVSIFDFDFCGNGFLVSDIGYYVMQLFNLEKDESQHKIKLESFLNGYESVTKISDDEKRIIPIMSTAAYLFYLGVQCQRFDNWSNVFLNEIYLKRFIELIIKKWVDFNKLMEQPKV